MTNNKLKIIAIICMIIDHFGYYYHEYIGMYGYLTCRIIGRCAMPIFTFLIVEGYIHTSNLKKYVLRISIFAVITQITLYVIDKIAQDRSFEISNTLNILFSYAFLLVLIKLFENVMSNKKIVFKLLLVLYAVFIVLLYQNVLIDYGYIVLVLGITMYIVKKYIKNIYFKNVLTAFVIIAVSTVLYLYESSIMLFAMLSILPILLYNQKKGYNNKVLRNIYYIIFPLQHLVLYGGYLLMK